MSLRSNGKTLFSAATIALIALSTGLIGCQSRFSEAPPQGINEMQKVSLDAREEAQGRIDQKLLQLERSATQIQDIINAFRKLKNPHDLQRTYTPIDFMIDVQRSLKQSLPVKSGSDFLQYGSFEIDTDDPEPKCRKIDTRLTSQLSEDSKDKQSDQLEFSIRSCSTGNEFIEVVKVELSERSLSFKINEGNLNRVVQHLTVEGLSSSPKCSVTQGISGDVTDLHCQNLPFALSATETVLVHLLSYSETGENRILLNSEIRENGILKATANLKIDQGGRTSFSLEPVETNNPL